MSFLNNTQNANAKEEQKEFVRLTPIEYRKKFKMKSGSYEISGDHAITQYLEYRNNYKERYGAYPEFDLINSPFCATIKGSSLSYNSIKRNPFYYVFPCPDRCIAFRKKYKELTDKHKYLISAFELISEDDINCINNLPEYENIKDGVGSRKLESGTYEEGTFENGVLRYGFRYFVNKIDEGYDHYILAGEFLSNELHGLAFNCTSNKKTIKMSKLTESKHLIGVINDNGNLEGKGVSAVSEANKNSATTAIAIGNYKNGVSDGPMLCKTFVNGSPDSMVYARYKDGDRQKKFFLLAFFETLLRLFTVICVIDAFVLFGIMWFYYHISPIAVIVLIIVGLSIPQPICLLVALIVAVIVGAITALRIVSRNKKTKQLIKDMK